MFARNRVFKIILIVTSMIIYCCDASHSTLNDNRRNDEFASITDVDHLAKQYSLVNTFRSLNVLGTLKQFPNGKVDTSDFGQNIHFGYRDKIKPGEKEIALNKIQRRLLNALLEILEQQLEEHD